MPNETTLLDELNQFTKRKHSLDEVYLFDLILCDNDLDRDGDCFTDDALAELQKRFIGVTGIFDHNPKSGNQAARIFHTELAFDPNRKTFSGKPYCCLRATAYTVRTQGNQDLIREIDGGIKKEVSISCAVKKQICSICGANRLQKPCPHVKGRSYSGAKCFHLLDEVSDAYEWSFVAIPAQPKAGVTKTCGAFSSDPEKIALQEELNAANASLDLLYNNLRQDVIRLCFRDGENACAKALANATIHMDIEQLLHLQKSLRVGLPQQDQIPQLNPAQNPHAHSANAFRIGGKPEV